MQAALPRRAIAATAVVASAAGGLLPSANAAPVRPRNPAPKLGQPGPPPAWVETGGRSTWLAFSSYCWATTCADMIPPQSRRDLPVVETRRGAVVRIHLGFDPTEAHITVLGGLALEHVALPPSRTLIWHAAGGGVVSVDLRGSGGSTGYLMRVRLR